MVLDGTWYLEIRVWLGNKDESFEEQMLLKFYSYESVYSTPSRTLWPFP